MRRLVLCGAIVLTLAAVVPAAGVESGDYAGCTATTGAAVLDATGPTCTFEVVVDTVTVFVVTLDANGTGIVSGSMTAENAGGDTQVAFIDVEFNDADAPSCGPTPFECHYASSEDTAFLRASPEDLLGVAKITCSAGMLAAVASVTCSATVLTVF